MRAPKYPSQLAQGQVALPERSVNQAHGVKDKGHPSSFAAIMTFALPRDGVHSFSTQAWSVGLDVFKPALKLSLQLMA